MTHLLEANKPPDFFLTYTVALFSKTEQSNQYVLSITNQYSMLRREISTLKTLAAHVTSIFMDYCLNPSNIVSYFLSDIETKVAEKFFATMFPTREVKHFTTGAYHLQTNEQTKPFNKTIFTRVRRHMAEHQTEPIPSFIR